tara:strand:- start:40 stop:192 length:153 start_codon:yes stop_codon:yes gene_type:complete
MQKRRIDGQVYKYRKSGRGVLHKMTREAIIEERREKADYARKRRVVSSSV